MKKFIRPSFSTACSVAHLVRHENDGDPPTYDNKALKYQKLVLRFYVKVAESVQELILSKYPTIINVLHGTSRTNVRTTCSSPPNFSQIRPISIAFYESNELSVQQCHNNAIEQLYLVKTQMKFFLQCNLSGVCRFHCDFQERFSLNII